MKKIIILSVLVLSLFSLLSFTSVEAKTIKVRGYYKPSIMKYVAPSYRTFPNKTRFDNYSTKGNYNPYTGKKGYTSPFKYRY